MRGLNKSFMSAVAVFAVLFAFTLFVNAEEYDLYVGAVQVTSENAADIYGDGTASYDAATNTLTLNNANITEFYRDYNKNTNIYSRDDLNIFLVGNNSLKVFPDDSSICEFSIGVEVNGNVCVTSDNEATLDIDVGTATRENFGFYTIGGSFTLSGKVMLDIALDDILITDDFGELDDTFGNSICIHSEYGAHFYDDVSVKGSTGNIFVPEEKGFVATLDNINSGGTSVGIAVYGELIIDTTGKIEIYVKDSDSKRAGIASFSNFELKNGDVFVEMAPSENKYLLAGPVVYVSTDDSLPCIPLCGDDEESLVVGATHSTAISIFPLNYYSSSDGTAPRYTMLVPSLVGIPEVEYDDEGNSFVTVTVEDEQKMQSAVTVFAAYNSLGRMTDVKFAYASQAQDGKLSVSLDVTEASWASIMVFESVNNMKPIASKLVFCDFQ